MDERHQVVKVPQPVPDGQRGFLGSVSSIYINGVKVQSQRLIQHTGSAELTIEGKNLKDTLRLLHDGVEYTPLTSTENSVTFILGDNGNNRIYVNGEYSFGVQISGIVVPEKLPNRISLAQTLREDINTSINILGVTASCLNYPYSFNEEYPNFRFGMGEETKPVTETSDFEGFNVNLSFDQIPVDRGYVRANCEVIDKSKPAYITYQGFIVAVFNYSA